MAKYLNKDQKKPGGKILVTVLILAVIAALAAVCVMHPEWFSIPDSGEATTAQTQNVTENVTETVTDPAPEQLTEPETLPALGYPLILEDGKLEITNLFQYEGMNPDCSLATGKKVASLMLKNTSGDYLEEAKIDLTLVDGTVLHFVVMDLPAGKTAMVFETANTAAEENAGCAEAVCTASWAEGIEPLPEDIAVSVDGITVTVTNNTGHDIPELVISCRCPLGEEYFGGVAYQYTINDLSAGESATVEALDCILGMAEVVRTAENQE